jgi:hypothetical protein
MDSGNNTIEKIIQMKLNDFLTIKGFQDKMANKIYNGIHEKLNNTTIEQLMVGSNIFNRGTSINKIKLIFEVYPNLLEDNIESQEKIIKITKIKGMSLISATHFIEKLPLFLDFLKKILNETQIKKLLTQLNITTTEISQWVPTISCSLTKIQTVKLTPFLSLSQMSFNRL